MQAKNTICLSIDRLHAGMLGSYGNTWVPTPQLDLLAAESFVFDQAYLDSPELTALFTSLWTGSHAWQDARGERPSETLLDRLRAAGLHTALITDDAQAAAHPLAASFAERILLEPTAVESPASEIEETQMARVIAAAADWLQPEKQPFFLWIHLRGMAGPWDAPLDLRHQFRDPEDPLPPQSVEVPCRMLPADHDPDELLGWVHAYAGQISLVDSLVGALIDGLRESPLAPSTLFTLMSLRGFPLGEHRRLGPVDAALYGELAQLVWCLRLPDGAGALARSQYLTQPMDLAPTLLDWLELAPLGSAVGRSLLPLAKGETLPPRDHLILLSDSDQAVRTRAWYLKKPQSDSAEQPVELYAKPGDRWEINEVANRLPETVAALEAVLANLSTSSFQDATPLAAELTVEID